MDDLIQHIQTLSHVHSITAKHEREVMQWWTQPSPRESELEPTEEQMSAAREAFPGFSEEDDASWGSWEAGGQDLAEEIGDQDETDSEVEGESSAHSSAQSLNQYITANPDAAWRILKTRTDSELGMWDILTGISHGGIRKAGAIAYKRCLLTTGVYRDEAGEDGILRWTIDGEQSEIGYWNKTLDGFVIRPETENVRYLQNFLSDQNRE